MDDDIYLEFDENLCCYFCELCGCEIDGELSFSTVFLCESCRSPIDENWLEDGF
jgi:hypothetical protein